MEKVNRGPWLAYWWPRTRHGRHAPGIRVEEAGSGHPGGRGSSGGGLNIRAKKNKDAAVNPPKRAAFLLAVLLLVAAGLIDRLTGRPAFMDRAAAGPGQEHLRQLGKANAMGGVGGTGREKNREQDKGDRAAKRHHRAPLPFPRERPSRRMGA